MFIADALNAMRAEAVVQQGGALQGFAGDHFDLRVFLAQAVAGSDGPGRTGCQGKARQIVAFAQHLPGDIQVSRAGHLVMPKVVAHLIELVEDHQVLAAAAQFPAFIKDLFHVGFGPGRGNHFSGNGLQPLKALAAHAFRQDGDGLAA